MTRRRVGAATLVLGAALSAGARWGPAQGPRDEPLLHSSVEGTLDRVVTAEKGLVVKTKAGQLLGWMLPAPVIAEAAKFKPGTPLWVMYRRLDADTDAVTAIGFPGVADMPVYVNATGYPVVLRTGPGVDGRCGGHDAASVNEQKLGRGIATELAGACWCCAPDGRSCAPSNHSGDGRIILAQCFESGRVSP